LRQHDEFVLVFFHFTLDVSDLLFPEIEAVDDVLESLGLVDAPFDFFS
jgi:hypothetical protein